MTTISFLRAGYFDASTSAAPGTWLRAIISDSSRYTVETNSTSKLVLVSNGAGFTAGWKVEFLPEVAFQPALVGHVAGPITAVNLYDPSGALVSSITELPPNTSFSLLTGTNWLDIFGAEFVGSDAADLLTGYANGEDLLQGGAGNDRLHGGTGAGSDVLIGGAGDDTLEGGAGDDLFQAGDGSDRIDGGDGIDIAFMDERSGTVAVWLNQTNAANSVRIDNVELVVMGDGGSHVFGSAKDDAVIGGEGRDVITGMEGADLIAGLGGNDEFHAGDGDDLMDGGEGDDFIEGGGGFDFADYSAATRGVTVDLQNNATFQPTGFGSDRLFSIEGLYGTEFADTLTGDAAGNALEGNLGDDDLFGLSGADTLTDEGGANFLRGGQGDDQVTGGANFDDAHGNEGNDTVRGGLGDDWVVGGKDRDQLYGELGDDIVYGNLGDDTCEGGDGADIVRGGQDQDVLFGGAGADWLSGDRGSDTLTGGAGADLFNSFGEAGLDRVLDFNAGEGDRVRLEPGSAYAVNQVGADTVVDITGGAQMVLVNVQLASLPAGWIFVA